ncbi:hypothetical protein ACSBR1_032711 [Camellia fascicularis]
MPHLSRVPDVLSTGEQNDATSSPAQGERKRDNVSRSSSSSSSSSDSGSSLSVSPGQPSSISDDEGVTLVGSGQDAPNLINQKEIHWAVSYSYLCSVS